MSTLKDAKVAKTAEIKEKLANAQSFVLVNYQGISVADDTALRNEFRKCGVDYHVYKNRLIKIALNELGYTEFDEALNGNTALAIQSGDDIGAPARIVVKTIKAGNTKLEIKCGCVEKQYLDGEGCKSLASLPTREGLISQVLGLLQAPIAGLARCINAIAEKNA